MATLKHVHAQPERFDLSLSRPEAEALVALLSHTAGNQKESIAGLLTPSLVALSAVGLNRFDARPGELGFDTSQRLFKGITYCQPNAAAAEAIRKLNPPMAYAGVDVRWDSVSPTAAEHSVRFAAAAEKVEAVRESFASVAQRACNRLAVRLELAAAADAAKAANRAAWDAGIARSEAGQQAEFASRRVDDWNDVLLRVKHPDSRAAASASLASAISREADALRALRAADIAADKAGKAAEAANAAHTAARDRARAAGVES